MSKTLFEMVGVALLMGCGPAFAAHHEGGHDMAAGAAAPSADATATEAKPVYECTMCNIRQDKPGRCPHCGMHLELSKTEPAAHTDSAQPAAHEHSDHAEEHHHHHDDGAAH